MKEKRMYNDLNNFYSVSKTLRFELRPIGETLDNLKENRVLEKDEKRREAYKKVKKIIDEYHREYITTQLSDFSLVGLKDYLSLFLINNRTASEEKQKKELEMNLRKQIVKKLKDSDKYKNLNKKEMIQNYLIEFLEENGRIEEIESVQQFNMFTTYFTGFFTSRENIYSSEEKSTALSYRLINENLSVFIKNMEAFSKLKSCMNINHIITDDTLLQGEDLESHFLISSFNNTLTQRGIERYNRLIGGYKKEDGTQIEGLNNFINLYNQKADKHSRIPKLNILYNQILADHETISFQLEKFDNDQELLENLKKVQSLVEQYCFNEGTDKVTALLSKINEYDLNKIYINKRDITYFSNEIFGKWSVLNEAIIYNYDNTNLKAKGKITKKYLDKRSNELKKIDFYSISKLNQYSSEVNSDNIDKIVSYFQSLKEKNYYDLIIDKFNSIASIMCDFNNAEKRLIKNDKAISSIKAYLDVLKEYQEFTKKLIPLDSSVEMDMNFYASLIEMNQFLEIIVTIYDKTRNYLTQKPFSSEKVKLNFDNSTLLDGWDINKEKDNYGMLFEKEGLYYLGILNRGNSSLFNQNVVPIDSKENNYNKIQYKLLPGPNKMLPKVFFSKSRRSEFGATDELYTKYKEGCHKKNNDNFSLEFCHELIEFYKRSLQIHEDWNQFDFAFKDTIEYNDIGEFYRDVEKQGYKIKYQSIPESYIKSLIKENKIYFFQIYNKDFSQLKKNDANSIKRKENLHTLYWKALFIKKNNEDVIYKLNGGAEIFYREASLSLEDTTIHIANKAIDNKNKLNEKKTSIFDYDIIKNRRYTQDKFLFHVPITMNFKARGINNLNKYVNEAIKKTDNNYIIGIDRGERNLIYISLIDENGKILLQESLNEICSGNNKVDYHSLLDEKEKDRDEARKSWKTIETIKDLKEGYLSQVVHRIVELMLEYNAIIVLENLNFGFKNTRTKVEKQVYQKFEKQLISKLNFLISKDAEKNELGSIMKPVQLSNKFESFKKMGKQSGVIFYVPAWNTSKIDPITGFVDLIHPKYESVEKAKELISKFAQIRYNSIKDYYEFVIDDYSKFTNYSYGIQNNWVLCTYGNRIENIRSDEANGKFVSKEINLNDEFNTLFKKYNIDSSNGLREEILKQEEKDFFMKLIRLIKLTLQMRNSISHSPIDYLISPVLDKDGNIFDSRNIPDTVNLPVDADANGAFNIARKGLMIVKQIKETKTEEELDKIEWNLSNQDYLSFVQSQHIGK